MNEHIADQRHLALDARIHAQSAEILELWGYIRYQARRIDKVEKLAAVTASINDNVGRLTLTAIDINNLATMDRAHLESLEQQLHDLTVQVSSLIHHNDLK